MTQANTSVPVTQVPDIGLYSQRYGGWWQATSLAAFHRQPADRRMIGWAMYDAGGGG